MAALDAADLAALINRIRRSLVEGSSRSDFELAPPPLKEKTIMRDGLKNTDLGYGEQEVKVSIVADGRHTRVELATEGERIGEGWATRHKRDERIPEAGLAIAAARAFEDAAAYYRNMATVMLGFDVK